MDSGVVTIVVAVVAAVASIVAAKFGNENKNAIQDVHLSLNSRLDALVAASEAKGRIAERGERLAADKAAEVPPKSWTDRD